MKNLSKIKPTLGTLLVLPAALLLCVTANAGITVTGSLTTPSTDADDQYLLLGKVNDVQNIGGSGQTSSGNNDASTYVANDRTSQGQTFTTGSNPLGYTLSSITVQHVLWNNYLNNGTWYNLVAGNTLEFQFGTIVGTTKTPIIGSTGVNNATFSGPGISGKGTSGTGTYLTFDLSQLAEQGMIGTLLPDTTYYFEIASGGGNPYFELNGADAASGLPQYAGGTAFSGTAPSTINSSYQPLNGDRVFVADLQSVHAAAVPEPATYAAGLCMAALLFFQRKKQS